MANRLSRKLAAILYADVAGYSRLTETDEEGTHRTLSSFLDAISDAVENHNGNVVHYAGDAVLADFSTVLEALDCAVALQRAFAVRNDDLPEAQVVQFRMGINLGDVIVDRDDIYGEGVNVAARLETLADPGGICISEAVRSAVGNKLPLSYDWLGEQRVKNIAEPVRAYRVVLDSDARPKRKTTTRLMHAGALLVGLVAMIGGLLGWLKPWSPHVEPTSSERSAVPVLVKPSIAVLAFDNLSGDPEQDFFSDGLSENIITRLARVPHLFVIARNYSFTYKGKAVNLQQVGKELGARYVVEGSVQKASNRVRITVQLIDASTGKHLWADKYDRDLENFFDLQDEITLNVVLEVLKGMEVKLTQQDVAKIRYNATENVEAWSYYAKGLNDFRQMNAFNNAQARKAFNRALTLDPDFDAASLGVGWTYYAQARWHWATGKYPYDRRTEFLATAAQIAQRVMARNDALAEPFALAGQIHMSGGDFDKAVRFGEQAVARNPNSASFRVNLADILSFAGKPGEALIHWDIAADLNPFPSDDLRVVQGRILYQLQRYDEAITVLQEIVDRTPDVFGGRERLEIISLTLLIASYSAMGNPKAKELALKHPHSYETILRKFFPFRKAGDSQRILDNLAEAHVDP